MQPARGRFARFDLDRQIASTFPAHWKVGPAPVNKCCHHTNEDVGILHKFEFLTTLFTAISLFLLGNCLTDNNYQLFKRLEQLVKRHGNILSTRSILGNVDMQFSWKKHFFFMIFAVK